MIEKKTSDEFVVVSCGMLGYGFPEASLNAAVAAGVDLIASDAGSSDPGAYYLGSGEPFVSETMTKRDLKLLIKAGADADAPLVIGSAGGAGTDGQVDALVKVAREALAELGITRSLAILKTELGPAVVREAIAGQRVQTFETFTPLSPYDVDQAVRIVAQVGCEAYYPALRQKPDILIVGRAWDVANIAALPILLGYPRGLALHMGKILECGSLAARPVAGSDLILGRLRDDHFIVEPTDPAKACTIASVSAHTFYEKTDPVMLAGPGGTVDLRGVVFDQIDPRRVKISGSVFHPADKYTVKLEGAKLEGYRHTSIGGVRDPVFIRQIDALQAKVVKHIRSFQKGIVDPSSYTINFHRYGIDGVMRAWEPVKTPAHEVGLLVDVVAETPELAEIVCAMVRSTLLHVGYEGRMATAGNIAFPFSPADTPGGPVYTFNIYHLMEIDDPETIGRLEIAA
jgi:hypothetical protein